MNFEFNKHRLDMTVLHLLNDLNGRSGFDLSGVDNSTLTEWKKDWFYLFCDRAVHSGGTYYFTEILVKLLINDLVRDLNNRGGFNTFAIDKKIMDSWKADWLKLIKEMSL